MISMVIQVLAVCLGGAEVRVPWWFLLYGIYSVGLTELVLVEMLNCWVWFGRVGVSYCRYGAEVVGCSCGPLSCMMWVFHSTFQEWEVCLLIV